MSESKFQFIDEEKEMSGEEYSDSEVEESPTNNETEVEAEPTTESEPETEEVNDEPTEETEEPANEPKDEVAEEPEAEESPSEASEDESEDDVEEQEKPEKEDVKKEQKEKAAKKIVKKMGDKGKYDSTNQMKTLIVMQVLGNTKNFFESQQALNDRDGFFTDITLPDTIISDNNLAAYLLFAGSDGLINDMVDSQWQK